MFDPAKCKGFLYYKLKNNRTETSTLVTNTASVNEREYTDDEINDLKTYFKTCVVSEQKDELLKKLEETIEIRKILLKDSETNFSEIFPFYFVSPDTVSIVTDRFVSVIKIELFSIS